MKPSTSVGKIIGKHIFLRSRSRVSSATSTSFHKTKERKRPWGASGRKPFICWTILGSRTLRPPFRSSLTHLGINFNSHRPHHGRFLALRQHHRQQLSDANLIILISPLHRAWPRLRLRTESTPGENKWVNAQLFASQRLGSPLLNA